MLQTPVLQRPGQVTRALDRVLHTVEKPARYTGGEKAMNAEILKLFDGQITEMVGQLRSVMAARDAKRWKEITHTIKGAARGVGAPEMAMRSQVSLAGAYRAPSMAYSIWPPSRMAPPQTTASSPIHAAVASARESPYSGQSATGLQVSVAGA